MDPTDRWALSDWQSARHWTKARNDKGIKVTLDILGESSRKKEEVLEAVNHYKEMISGIASDRLDAAITIKITSLGYFLDREVCLRNVLDICRSADRAKVGFEIDMEGRSLVDFSLKAAISCSEDGLKVTIALQAYLDRTAKDIESMIKNGVRIRLVKGAYVGDTRDFHVIQGRILGFAKMLSETRVAFALGTHDPDVISWVKEETDLSYNRLELGMLKGLSDETKLEFARNNWRVAEYVPFGLNSIAYIQRRLDYLQQLKILGRLPAP